MYIQESLFNIDPSEKQLVLSEWNSLVEEIRDTIPTDTELSLMLADNGIDNEEGIPGSISVGDRPDYLWLISCEVHGSEKFASEITTHEMVHAQVFREHGVPVQFGFHISRLNDNSLQYRPFVQPLYPPEMALEERESIHQKALRAVPDPSEFDILATQPRAREAFIAELKKSKNQY